MTINCMNDPVASGTQEPQQRLVFGSVSAPENGIAGSYGGLEPTDPNAKARRLFFPTNREDVLLQLSSLAISRGFPAGLTVVATQHHTLALFPDGLRSDEASLLQNGRTGRFPILIELDASERGECGVFGIGEVIALCFRSKAEADDFRYRPVDEFNTDAMTCRVEPALFELAGVVRFKNGAEEAGESSDRGGFADRVAGGVCSVLELGAIEPDCWHDIAELLCRPCGPAALNEITLAKALGMGCPTGSDGGQIDAVLRAFIAHAAGESSSSLVARLHMQLIDDSANADQLRIAERWFFMASGLLQNHARLDGQPLSDEKSVALRAALLASVVDEVRALIPFRHAPKPAGRKVITTAAFLIGLRTGITDMPWSMKCTQLGVLSPLIVALREAAPEGRGRVGQGFQFEPDETAAGVVLRLFWRDLELACWQPCETETPLLMDVSDGKFDAATEAQLVPQSDKTVGPDAQVDCGTGASESGPTKCIQSVDGRLIEILFAEPPHQGRVTLKCVLSDLDRLRKPKEILEIACASGLLWRVGISADGAAALYADLMHWPDEALLTEMSGSLACALDAYLVAKKVRTSGGSSGRGKLPEKGRETKAAKLTTKALP